MNEKNQKFLERYGSKMKKLGEIIGTDKCIIPGCTNHRCEGGFHDNFCTPCFYYLTGYKGGEHSQAARNMEAIKLQLSLVYLGNFPNGTLKQLFKEMKDEEDHLD